MLVVSAVKDAYEDICRWRQDRTINGKECKVLVERHGRLCEQAIEWQAVRVGDLLVVKQDEQLPADMILIDTDAADGICYVDTVNLDGESNLKPRHALTCTQARTCQTKEQVADGRPPHQEDLGTVLHGVLVTVVFIPPAGWVVLQT